MGHTSTFAIATEATPEAATVAPTEVAAVTPTEATAVATPEVTSVTAAEASTEAPSAAIEFRRAATTTTSAPNTHEAIVLHGRWRRA